MLGAFGAAILACGFDTSGIGSSGDVADSGTTSGMPGSEDGDAAGTQPSDSDDGEIDSDDDDSAEADDDPSADSGADETTGGEICVDWWNPAWTRRREVMLGQTDLASALMDVPVLVRLAADRIDYTATQIGGTDLRFVDTSGKALEYEIETWDPEDDSYVWLRVPVVAPMGEAQARIVMYYGNPAAPDDDTPQDVWEPGFVSVHHMRALMDATANAHHGESPTPPSAVEGWIGGAGGFDGYDDHVKLTGEPAYDLQDAITIEAWIRVESFDVWYQAIVTKGDDSWRLHREAYTDDVGFGTNVLAGYNDNLAGMVSVNDGQWHYVVAVFGAGEKQIFVDGVLDNSVKYAGPLRLSDYDVLIGENQQNQYRFFEGDIDEVRISSVARSRGWIALQARSMNDELLDLGPEETCP